MTRSSGQAVPRDVEERIIRNALNSAKDAQEVQAVFEYRSKFPLLASPDTPSTVASKVDSYHAPSSPTPVVSSHSFLSGSRRYDYFYRPPVGDHYVPGYIRLDGTSVRGHHKTDSDDSFWNNYSSKGNINPYTGQTGKKTPWASRHSGSGWVNSYYRSDGTYVSGHYRN
jgi:hypothetical protein